MADTRGPTAAVMLQSAWRCCLARGALSRAARERQDQRSAGLTLARFVRVVMARQTAQQVQIRTVAVFLEQSGTWWCPGRVPSRAPGPDLALAWMRLGSMPPQGGTQLALPRLAAHLRLSVMNDHLPSDMNDHLPSGRPPDSTGPPAPCAPAASL